MRTGKTLEFCIKLKDSLEKGKNVSIASKTFPARIITTLKHLGIEVTVTELKKHPYLTSTGHIDIEYDGTVNYGDTPIFYKVELTSK